MRQGKPQLSLNFQFEQNRTRTEKHIWIIYFTVFYDYFSLITKPHRSAGHRVFNLNATNPELGRSEFHYCTIDFQF